MIWSLKAPNSTPVLCPRLDLKHGEVMAFSFWCAAFRCVGHTPHLRFVCQLHHECLLCYSLHEMCAQAWRLLNVFSQNTCTPVPNSPGCQLLLLMLIHAELKQNQQSRGPLRATVVIVKLGVSSISSQCELPCTFFDTVIIFWPEAYARHLLF